MQGLAIAGELEDQLGEGVIHHNMGMTYEMLANLDQTQEHFEKVWNDQGGGGAETMYMTTN